MVTLNIMLPLNWPDSHSSGIWKPNRPKISYSCQKSEVEGPFTPASIVQSRNVDGLAQQYSGP